MLRILLADRSQTFTELVARRLNQETGMIVVAVGRPAETDPACIAAVDVAIVDARLLDDFVAARPAGWTRGQAPALIVMADLRDHDVAPDALRAGAVGWVDRTESVEVLAQTIRAVQRGETRIRQPILARALGGVDTASFAPGSGRARGAMLTDRESEILVLLEQGCDRADIARRLHLSPNTVRTHVQNILHRLGVHSTLAAVAKVRAEAASAAMPAPLSRTVGAPALTGLATGQRVEGRAPDVPGGRVGHMT